MESKNLCQVLNLYSSLRGKGAGEGCVVYIHNMPTSPVWESGERWREREREAMEIWSWVASLMAAIGISGSIMMVAGVWRRRVVYLPKLQAQQAPYPKGSLGLPLLGETLELFRDFRRCPDNFLQKRIARFGKGRGCFKTHLFGSPTILAINPESIRAIAMDGENFAPGWPKTTMTLAGGQSFLALQGNKYRTLRRLAMSTIASRKTLKSLISLVENCTNQALQKWSNKGQILLLDELLKLSFDIIATLLMGKLSEKEVEEFCKEFRELNDGIRALPFNVPGFAYYHALKARKKIEKRLQSHIDSRITNKNVVHGDVLETFMEMIDDEGNKLSSEQLIDMIIAFMLAGHESSAHSAMWIMIFLSKNPNKLEKLMEEQTRISTKDCISEEHLCASYYKKMTYLNWVIDETLRIVNISPFTFRKSLRSVEINGYTIPKNWNVALWYRANHLNEEFFPSPYTFNPERWENAKLKTGMYTPFGLGARSCIGVDLAKLELAVLVHKMVLSYRWELANPNADIRYLPRVKPYDNCPTYFFPRSQQVQYA